MPELSVTAALIPFRIFPGGFPENVTLLAPTDAAWNELMHYSAGLDTMQQLVAQPDFATLLRYHVLDQLHRQSQRRRARSSHPHV